MIKDHKQFNILGRKVFERAVVSPPFRFFYEMPDEACFYYLCKGQNKVYSRTEHLELSTLEGVVMQCGTYLCDVLSSDKSEFCEAIAVHLPLEVLKVIYDIEFPNFLLKVNEAEPVQLEKYESSELLKIYIDSLQFYFDNPLVVSEEILKLKLKELVLLLARTDNAEVIQQLLAGLFTPIEIEFKAIIEANLFTNLNIEALAKLTNLSLSSFKREFAKHYQNSPARYIRERRLDKASTLLLGSDLRISDIAYDCGFSDLAHFSKTFQKKHHYSPSEYRMVLIDKSLDQTPN